MLTSGSVLGQHRKQKPSNIMNGITAKMVCHKDPNKGSYDEVQMNAVYAETGVNKSWAESTPCGGLNLTITNPDARGFIVPGKEYIITIREATSGE